MNKLFLILLGGAIFATSAFFVTPEISTKYHFVIFVTLVGGGMGIMAENTPSGYDLRGAGFKLYIFFHNLYYCPRLVFWLL